MDDGLSAFLSNFHVSQVAWASIVTLAIISILRGWLIPRIWHMDRIADKDDQIKHLREALAKSEEANAIIRQQNGKLIDSGETTKRLLETLRAQAANPPANPPTQGGG